MVLEVAEVHELPCTASWLASCKPSLGGDGALRDGIVGAAFRLKRIAKSKAGSMRDPDTMFAFDCCSFPTSLVAAAAPTGAGAGAGAASGM